jgi:polar amino acid transport system permease protein
VSLITISDLTFRAYQLNQVTMRTATIFLTVLAVYFALAQVVSAAMGALERHLARGRGKAGLR